MKIKANKLFEFVSKATINGVITTSFLDFTETGLKIRLQSSNIVFVDSILDKSIFQDYEQLKEVGIKNNAMFLSLLKRYNEDVIKLDVESNKLKIISETGSTFYTLCEKDMVDNYIDKKLTLHKLDEGFELDSTKLKSIKSAGEILKVNTTNISINNNSLVMSVETDTGDKITETLDINYKECNGIYGDFLQKIISVVDGKVNVSLDKEYPIRIIQKNANSNIEYLLAPMSTEN